MEEAVAGLQQDALGDAYARQRTRGLRQLRFNAALEREYRGHMRDGQRASTLICAATALAIWVSFIAFDMMRLDLLAEIAGRHYDVWTLEAARLATLAVLMSLVGRLAFGPLERTYRWHVMTVLIMIGACAAFAANTFKLRHLPHADLAQLVIILAVFLPVGLTFYQSLAVAVVIAIFTAAAGLLMLEASDIREHIRLSITVFSAVCVGAVGAYLREYAERDQFLLSRILHHAAMVDALTGIGNRRHFEERTAKALRQSLRDRVEVVFAILDVDHFKMYNDRYGHHAGDIALRAVAQTIENGLRRPLDMAGRLGGEEFGLLIYGVRPEQAQIILDDIVRMVSELDLTHLASPTASHVTVSIGAAFFDRKEALEHLYRRADMLLYEAKSEGRNRAKLEVRHAEQARAAA